MKKYKGLIVGCVSTIFFIFLGVNNAKPKVIFNFTPSIPLGIYMVKDKKSFVTGDVLVFAPPENVEKIVHDRKWLVAKRGYLLKPIVAVPGDSVCIENSHFYVNNLDFGEVKSQDKEGRWLPDYHFCGTVKPGTFFVGVRAGNSFDSRYFGPIKTTQILGVAKNILTLPLLDKCQKNYPADQKNN